MSSVAEMKSLGLCYGKMEIILPSPDWVLRKYRELNVSKVLICDTNVRDVSQNATTLLGLIIEGNHDMRVVFGIDNSELESLADAVNAARWVDTYVARYEPIISYVCVGDLSKLATDQDFRNFSSAINNIKEKVPDTVKVSTMVDVSMLVSSFSVITAPSKCRFDDRYKDLITYVVLPLLKASSSPLFARIIPYFYIINDNKKKADDLLNYRIDDGAEIFTTDDGSSCKYQYVYDAMLDSVYSALDLCGSEDKVDVCVVSGWPMLRPELQSGAENQKAYFNNLGKHACVGTPRKKGTFIQNYVYYLLDQDLKPGTEEEWIELKRTLSPMV